jgi:hypothetical protein
MTFERLPAQRPYIPTQVASPQCCLKRATYWPSWLRGLSIWITLVAVVS